MLRLVLFRLIINLFFIFLCFSVCVSYDFFPLIVSMIALITCYRIITNQSIHTSPVLFFMDVGKLGAWYGYYTIHQRKKLILITCPYLCTSVGEYCWVLPHAKIRERWWWWWWLLVVVEVSGYNKKMMTISISLSLSLFFPSLKFVAVKWCCIYLIKEERCCKFDKIGLYKRFDVQYKQSDGVYLCYIYTRTRKFNQ